MKASVKFLEKNKWLPLKMKDCMGMSIAYIMSKAEKTMVGALLDDKDTPVFFLTNNKEQFDKYKEKAYTMMVDDLILLLGSEVIPNHPVTVACLKAFPDSTFEVIEDQRVDDKKWW